MHVVARAIASAAILTGLDPDAAADVMAVRWISCKAVVSYVASMARSGLVYSHGALRPRQQDPDRFIYFPFSASTGAFARRKRPLRPAASSQEFGPSRPSADRNQISNQ